MPIYEYDCLDCKRRVSLFFRTFSDALRAAEGAEGAAAATLRCPRCQGTRLRRAVSRVAVLRSEESRLANLEDASLLSGLDADDPRAMGQLMRSMSEELDEPMDDETADLVGRLDAGEQETDDG